MARAMLSDVRKLAVTVLGTTKQWSYPEVPRNQAPLVKNIDLDEVVIHFRCGDILGGVKRHDFGIIHFSEYVKWISNSSKNFGIVTQPFVKGKYTRVADDNKSLQCREVVRALVG